MQFYDLWGTPSVEIQPRPIVEFDVYPSPVSLQNLGFSANFEPISAEIDEFIFPSAPKTAEYVQKLEELKLLVKFLIPGTPAPHVLKEINRLKEELRQICFKNKAVVPESSQPVEKSEPVVVIEKFYIQKEYQAGFIARFLGPRGRRAQWMTEETNCKISIRGKGSMRNKEKEEEYRKKPEFANLNEEMHVIVRCEDPSEERCKANVARAMQLIYKVLVPFSQQKRQKNAKSG